MAAVCWIKWWSVKQFFHVFPQSSRKGSFEVKGCHWRRGNWHSHLWLLNLHCQTAEKKIANGSWVLYSFGIVFLNFRSHVTPSIAALDVVLKCLNSIAFAFTVTVAGNKQWLNSSRYQFRHFSHVNHVYITCHYFHQVGSSRRHYQLHHVLWCLHQLWRPVSNRIRLSSAKFIVCLWISQIWSLSLLNPFCNEVSPICSCLLVTFKNLCVHHVLNL